MRLTFGSDRVSGVARNKGKHAGTHGRFASGLMSLALLAACADPEHMPDFDAGAITPHEAVVEPAVEVADAAASPMIAFEPPVSGTARRAKRGVVTAGDIDDTLNLDVFKRYQTRTAKELDLPRANLLTPVQVQFVGPQDRAAPGVSYSLYRPGTPDPFHTGYSGVDGRITVFPASLGVGRQNKVELRAFEEGEEILRQTVSTGPCIV